MTDRIETEPRDTQLGNIQILGRTLSSLNNLEKLNFLNDHEKVKNFLASSPKLDAFYRAATPDEKRAIASILALGLGENVFFGLDQLAEFQEPLQSIVGQLVEIQNFYEPIGGIVGYQIHALQLIDSHENPKPQENSPCTYIHPQGIDLTKDTLDTRQMVRTGIERMGDLADIYPIGGAGDRLHLQDPITGEHLPVAQLQFCGRSLLEGLIRELQGREFLHYKFFGKQFYTPVVLMTSHEKGNHGRIMGLCSEHNWFGRDPESFKVITQLLVPMVAVDGSWVMKGPLYPLLKPGGHGVLWKESLDQGVFDWLREKKRSKVLIRQINNPIGGTDNGILALEGLVCQRGKTFGFASCDRLVGSPEGMIVLRERKVEDGFEYCITNIEYTDFKMCGIEDVSSSKGSAYSQFPSNTNILVADISAVEAACRKFPIPGMLINIKHLVPCHSSKSVIEKRAGRIESVMQNIADHLVDVFPAPLDEGESNRLQSFLTYNARRKTISVTKQAFVPGKDIAGTPEGAFYDLLENYRDLLHNYCGMELPQQEDEHTYQLGGPAFVVDLHPAMGMLYQILAKKIRGGRLGHKSEWIMDVGEAYVENLDLEGSLIIEADAPYGQKDHLGVIHYDTGRCGKCILKNVTVRNVGAVLDDPAECYRRSYSRAETAHIIIHGNGEFVAENVTFIGEVFFEVPENHRLVVYEQGGEIAWHHERISQATWTWNYSFDEEDRINLYFEESS